MSGTTPTVPETGGRPDGSAVRVIVLMGVSGSGKSTTGQRLARRLAWPFRDADTFHPEANIEKMKSGIPLDDTDRGPWLAAIAAWIDAHRAAGTQGIVSCSALKRAYRSVLLGDRADVRLVYLKGDIGTIGARMARRKGHFMPTTLLQSQFATLEEPTPDEHAVIVPIRLPPRAVVNRIIAGLDLVAPAR